MFFFVASNLSFDDKIKQKAYTSISFEKLRGEIETRKVCVLLAAMWAFYCSVYVTQYYLYLFYLHDSIGEAYISSSH